MEDTNSIEENNEIYSVDYNKNTQIIIAGGRSNSILLYSLIDNKYTNYESVDGLEDSVLFVAFVSEYLAVGVTMQGQIVYICINEQSKSIETIDILETYTEPTVICMSDDKKYIFLYSEDNRILGYSTHYNREYQESVISLCTNSSSAVIAMEHYSNLLYVATHENVIVFDTLSQRVIYQYHSPEKSSISAMKYRRDRNTIAIGYTDGTCVILAVPSNRTQPIIAVHRTISLENDQHNQIENSQENNLMEESSNCIESLVFAEDTLVYGCYNATIRMVNIKTKKEKQCILPVSGDCCTVRLLSISPEYVIAFTSTKGIFVIDIRSENTIVATYPVESTLFDGGLIGKAFFYAATFDGLQFIPV
ncbi:hypothetical protein NEOKW01_0709 [Nematocida sp. AWRm80]|nr:hypothetical protein NEOKW01_0709 [Nematocida sp. AWRm80]